MTAVSGSNRVNRGGSWNNNARNCRASNRNNNSPGNRNNNLGFRLLSTRRRQRARFKDPAREPAPCPGGPSRSGKKPDEQQQPAASGRHECATAAAGNSPVPDRGKIQRDSSNRASRDCFALGWKPGVDSLGAGAPLPNRGGRPRKGRPCGIGLKIGKPLGVPPRNRAGRPDSVRVRKPMIPEQMLVSPRSALGPGCPGNRIVRSFKLVLACIRSPVRDWRARRHNYHGARVILIVGGHWSPLPGCLQVARLGVRVGITLLRSRDQELSRSRIPLWWSNSKRYFHSLASAHSSSSVR